MIYVISCSDPSGVPSFDAGGAVVCSVGSPAMLQDAPNLSQLSQSDVESLLSSALVVIALAWGFKAVGRLIFPMR